MKMATAAKLLEDFGPVTAPDVRVKAGITAKGCPTSSRFFSLYKLGHATKKKGPNGNLYGLTKKGKEWLSSRYSEVEAINDINEMDYSHLGSGSTKTVASPKLSKSAGIAVNSIVDLVNTNEETMKFLRGLHIQIGNFLEEHGQLED